MTIAQSQLILDLYDRALATAGHVLRKSADWARAKGIEESEMLGWRLIEDMHPLAFHLMVVNDFSVRWPARIAGLEPPEGVAADGDVAGFLAAFEASRSYLATFPADRLAAEFDRTVTHRISSENEFTMTGEKWLAVFALTNIHFHLSTAYGILRSRGAPLGKPDMFAGGF